MTPRRPAMRYHGGKWLAARAIIRHFPTHRFYVEPFGGAASVLLQKPRASVEVYNDLDGEIVNVFRVLRDPATAAELRRVCELTPYARVEFEAAYEPAADPVEQARRTVFRSFAGHGSAAASGYDTGFRNYYKGANGRAVPSIDWQRWPSTIDALADRLRGVVIENLPAADVLGRYDGDDVLFYCDPPYVSDTRNTSTRGGENIAYRYEMTDADHLRLLDRLRAVRGAVVLSGYRSDLYDAALADWRRVEFAARGDGRRARVECLWLNAAAAERKRQPPLFGAGAASYNDHSPAAATG